MSIVPLVKVTVCARISDKVRVLERLQEIGCLHLIPLTEEGAEAAEQGPSAEAREALKFLLSCPQRRRQVRDASRFDANAVERRALELRDRVEELCDERDFLRNRISAVRPWGEFCFHPVEQVRGYRLWFYQVPRHQLKKVEDTDLIWEIVGEDNQFFRVVVISPDAPEGMPVPRVHIGAKPLSELHARLEQVQVELEDLQAERAGLTRWLDLFIKNLSRLEDRQELFDAFLQTYDEAPLVAVQGWAPRDRVPELEEYAATGAVALHLEEPAPADQPPTLFHNPEAIEPGEALVQFYMMPSYWLWDPSGVVLFSFSLFFAMILSDAGYAALLGLMLVLGWRKMGGSASNRRIRRMFAYLIGASLGWGVVVGSYFGVAPPAGSLVARLKLLDVNYTATMMSISIFIGAAHIAYACLRDAWRQRSNPAGLAPLGWGAIILGGLTLYLTGVDTNALAGQAGLGGMALGAVLVLVFTGAGLSPGKRIMAGLMGFTGVSKAFGDVLSYLRLFALGLASASLALAFNGLARQVAGAIPGVGLLLGLVVLVVGHSLNLLLAIVSGFVHGLRLNLIEFFNWSIKEEGRPFRAFRKREAAN